MAKGKSSIGFWLLIGTIVVGGGIGAYFLLRKPKEEEEETIVTDDTDKGNAGSGSGSGSGSGTATYTAPSELSDSTKIKAFQDWMDANKPCWVLDSDGKYKNLSKNVGKCDRNTGGKGYGNYAKNTDNAWKTFGKDYLASVKAGTSTSTTSSSNTNLNKNIDYIVKNASGSKSDKTYLSKSSADFVEKWANALKKDRSTFLWANQIYNAKTGDRILEYNPYDKTIYALPKNTRGYKFRTVKYNDGSNAIPNAELGKIKDVAFVNGEVIFYVPNQSSYDWFKEKYVTRNKPKSSFDGRNEQIEFSNFNNNFDLNL
jgi:hypothetical protein